MCINVKKYIFGILYFFRIVDHNNIFDLDFYTKKDGKRYDKIDLDTKNDNIGTKKDAKIYIDIGTIKNYSYLIDYLGTKKDTKREDLDTKRDDLDTTKENLATKKEDTDKYRIYISKI